MMDMIGIVTTYEGDPLPSGDIASRLGGFADVDKMEQAGGRTTPRSSRRCSAARTTCTTTTRTIQAFLDNGGKIGLQHDPLLYGAYALNPFLVSVELVPMLVVEQGQVAVIKAYVGLVTQDTSGAEFKFGSLVRPGHRGIWQEPLRTGKYPINPRCYQAEIVPTAILTLNWADAISQAHNLDARLEQIEAKSREGFVFKIDLQVQIHVPDTKAPRVISMVGTMQNLVNEVLQAAVGNHFRDKLQSMPAVTFIETRQQVQQEAFEHISQQLAEYQVETKGVYIQDVVLPEDLVQVLTQREIANQEIETFKKQRAAQEQRIAMEQAKGTADMQAQAGAVEGQRGHRDQQRQRAEGEGRRRGDLHPRDRHGQGRRGRSGRSGPRQGLPGAGQALGQTPTALVNAVTVLAERKAKFMPEILVTGGSGGGGSIDGLAATLMRYLGGGSGGSQAGPALPVVQTEAKTDVGAMVTDIAPPPPKPETAPEQPKPEPKPAEKPPQKPADAGGKGQQGPKKA